MEALKKLLDSLVNYFTKPVAKPEVKKVRKPRNKKEK